MDGIVKGNKRSLYLLQQVIKKIKNESDLTDIELTDILIDSIDANQYVKNVLGLENNINYYEFNKEMIKNTWNKFRNCVSKYLKPVADKTGCDFIFLQEVSLWHKSDSFLIFLITC
jgi:hypothetical protein